MYGDPGVGKTYLAGTAQDHEDTRPVLIIDVEGGTVTLRHRTDIDVVSVRAITQIKEIYDQLTKEQYYKTVVIDSLTELQKLDMRDIMRELVSRKPERDPDVPDQREWGKSGEHIRSIVRAFRDLPCNTIMTALAATVQADSGAITYHPDLPGKLRAHIPGFMDIVGYMYVVQDGEVIQRRLQVTPTRAIRAKDRTGNLGGVVENPSIPMLWALIN